MNKNHCNWLKLLVFTLSFSFSLNALAQTKSNKGTEFWLGFMKHDEGTRAGMSLYITSDSNASGTVSIPGQNWSTTFNVTANNLTVVNVDVPSAYVSCSDCIENKAVKVTSNKDVIVYAHHYEGNKSDATLVLPTRTLGKEYYVMSYREESQFLIVGTKDNTKVNITPSVRLDRAAGGTRAANVTYQITLDEGEIYQGLADDTRNGDVTGTFIEVIDTGVNANCRTVAVFGGNAYSRLGNCTGGWGTFNSGDNLYEQMFPTNSWGQNFVLVPAKDRNSDDFKIIASKDNTRVTVLAPSGPPLVQTINAGDYVFIDNEDQIRFATADQPVMVAQFQQQSRCDGRTRIGDPSMTIINPLEQTLKDITLYSSSFFDIDDHHINIVMPTAHTSSFTLDGSSVSWSTVPRKTNYSYARVKVSAGNHRLKANVGFIATAYGKGEFESYGYAAGANVKDLTATAEVANSPQVDEISGCIGRPTQFSGDAEYDVVKWEWDFGDGNTDTIQNPTHTYGDTGTYVARLYTYKPSFDGCSNYDSSFVEVTIYDKPKAKMLWTPICENGTTVFTDFSTIPAEETYLTTRWIIDGQAPTFGRTTSRRFDTVGKFPIFMEVVTAKQCRDTIIDSLVVSPLPTAIASFDNVCFYDTAFFSSQSTVPTGSVDSFAWQFSDNSDTTFIQENRNHFFTDAGFYDVKLEVWSDSGCRAQFDSFIYKHPRFDVQFLANDTCFGIENKFTNSTILEGGKYTDTVWYIGSLDTVYTYDSDYTFENEGSYEVQLIMEQDSFCKDTFSQTISVDPIPVADFSVENTCLGEEAIFTDNSTISSGDYSVDWNFNDGYTGTSNPDTVTYASGGVKSVVLTVTSDEGCTHDTTKLIRITYPEISDISVQNVCLNKPQNIASINTLGLDSFTTYTWQINGSIVSTDSSFEYTSISTGSNYISLLVETKNGCSIGREDSFEVFNAPNGNFLIVPICEGEDLLPTDNSNIDAPEVISSYDWLIDDLSVATDQNPTISDLAAGTYSLSQIVASSNGCTDTTTKSIFVYPVPDNGYIVDALCEGDVTLFTSQTAISSGTISSTIWNIEGTTSSGTSTSYTYPSADDYTFTLITTSNEGCSDTLNNTITINPLPILDISLEEYEGCVPFQVEVNNNSSIASGAIGSYSWDWGDGSTEDGDIDNHTYTSPGTYSISVTADSDEGCTSEMTLGTQVTVHDLPTAEFTFSPSEPSTITEFVTFSDSGSIGNITGWEWTTSDGGYYSGSSVEHTFADSGTYEVILTVSDDNECQDEESKLIYVNADLFVHIPSSFTPNGDLINDYFGLGGLTQGVVSMEMKIYNRWGEQIFESNDVNKKWDGTYKGKPVPQGIYLYLVRFTNPKQSRWYYYNGEIHLIR